MENEVATETLVSEEPVNAEKIYPVSQVFGALFLGGPMVGGYLMTENNKVLGQSERNRNIWLAATGFTILLFRLLPCYPIPCTEPVMEYRCCTVSLVSG